MILITGDTHGDQYKWIEQIDSVLSPSDIILVCGDFGVGFWNGRYWSEETFYDFLNKQEYIVLFIDGNHENFDKLNSYSVERWGGGYSIDKYLRTEGVSWWTQEMPSEEEYHNAIVNLEKVRNHVDYIITHTAPAESVYYLSTLRSWGIRNDVIQEQPLTIFLDEIQRKVTYKYWYFGHFHVDLKLWRNQTAVLSSVRELETGKIVRQWDSM